MLKISIFCGLSIRKYREDFMFFVIAIAIVAWLIVSIVKYKNKFVPLAESIRQLKSDLNNARDRYNEVEYRSRGLVLWSTKIVTLSPKLSF